MISIEVTKDKNIVSIISLNVGRISEDKASQVCDEFEKSLISNGCNAIVVRDVGISTNAIEIYKNDNVVQVIFIPTGKMTSTKKEQYLEVVREKLRKYGIINFILMSITDDN